MTIRLLGIALVFAAGVHDCGQPTQERQASVAGSLKFIAEAAPANKPLGWSALEAALKQPGTTLPPAAKQQVEQTARTASSAESLAALMTLYAADPTFRHQRLQDLTPENRPLFHLAALAEAKDRRSPGSPPGPGGDTAALPQTGATLEQMTVRVLTAADRSTIGPAIGDVLTRLTSPADTAQSVAAIAVASALHGPESAAHGTDVSKLRTFLIAAAASRVSAANAEELLIGRSAEESLRSLPASDLELNAILDGVTLDPRTADATLEDRDVRLTVKPVTIAADTTELVCVNCDARRVHVQASTPAIPINSIPGGASGGRFSYTQPAAQGVAFANGHQGFYCLTGSEEFIGSCFIARPTTVAESDTPGAPVAAFGVTHRTWLPRGTQAPARPVFELKAAYQPAPETNWVGVRWKSPRGATTTIHVVSGVTTPDPITTENRTGWAVYTVIPGRRLEFQLEYTAIAEITGYAPHAHAAATLASDTTDLLEIVELNDVRISQLPAIDPDGILSPASATAILSYAASLQRSMAPGGWLDLRSADEAHRTSLALAKLSILRRLADALDTTPGIAASDPTYVNIQWRERQTLLRRSLPSLAYRLFQLHSERLEAQLAQTTGLAPQLRMASANLSCTAQSLSRLTLDVARDVLSTGSSAVPGSHIDPTDPILKNLADLQTAIVGLQAQVASVTEQVYANQAFQCAAVKALQSDRFAIFPMAPTDTARQTCATEPPAPVNLCP